MENKCLLISLTTKMKLMTMMLVLMTVGYSTTFFYVSKDEKPMMHLWNSFVRKQR
ncbi:putative polycomb protein, VEFS-Box [Helianthus anomalus]